MNYLNESNDFFLSMLSQVFKDTHACKHTYIEDIADVCKDLLKHKYKNLISV